MIIFGSCQCTLVCVGMNSVILYLKSLLTTVRFARFSVAFVTINMFIEWSLDIST